MRSDDREDDARLMALLDDHDTGQRHDPDHHREARERGEQRGKNARPLQDLSQRSGLTGVRASLG
jgi:hypothetical protein